MISCPKCNANLEDDFGLIQCDSCGASLFIGMDGDVRAHDENQEILQGPLTGVAEGGVLYQPLDEEVKPPPEDFVFSKEDLDSSDMSLEPSLHEAPSDEFVLEEQEPFVENPLDSEESFAEQELSEDNYDENSVASLEESEENIVSGEDDQEDQAEAEPDSEYFEDNEFHVEPIEDEIYSEPSGVEVPGDEFEESAQGNSDLSDIAEYGNSTESQAHQGLIRYNVIIRGVDTIEMKNHVKDSIRDSRFMWDLEAVIASIDDGVLILKDLTSIKAVIVVNRLKILPLEISWEQYALNEA